MPEDKIERHKPKPHPDTKIKSKPVKEPEPSVIPAMEEAVGITVQELSYLLQLETVKGLGPQKFKSAFEMGLRPKDLLDNPKQLRIQGKRGKEIQRSIARVANQDNVLHVARAKRYIAQAHRYEAQIITYWHPSYPQIVFRSNYPTPIIYARGSLKVLASTKNVACVGSRKIRSPYSERHEEFAKLASQLGFTIVAGFALGADTLGHKAAVNVGGNTICVMAGGLDRPFPPENRALWETFLKCPGVVFISEAPFGARAAGLTLRKRNKLIVSFSLGVLVSQSAENGGTMNAYRFSLEQHKPVGTFFDDETKDTSGNRVITQTTKVPVAVFNSKEQDHESWQRWLQQLSFSI
jgi:DNA processing protein